MSASHTPGPWTVPCLTAKEGDCGCGFVLAEQQRGGMGAICEVLHGGENEPRDTAEANARLIAAAPNMLAVLRELQDSAAYWSEYDVPLGIVERITAAIAQATGGKA